MTADVVLYEVLDGVALVTLNRPDRLNAWTGELERAYFAALDRAADDDDVKVVVVTGAGKGYCAGADMTTLQSIGGSGGGDADDARTDDADAAGGASAAGGGDPARGRHMYETIAVPKPVIAAINGACAGIGLAQALFCDLRFAAEGAKLTTAFARRGLIAEHGMSWALPRLIGPAAAMDLLFSGRVVLAEEAVAMGLVNRVIAADSLVDETMAYARELAALSSPTSMAVMKRQVWSHTDLALGDAADESMALMSASVWRSDFVEGVASFVDKRPPAFSPIDAAALAEVSRSPAR